MVRPSDFMASLDLESVYLHVPVAPEFRKFLQFRVGDCGFRFNVLPFGLSTAPFWFSRVISPIVKQLSRKGVKIAAYLDDFIIVGPEERIADDVGVAEALLKQAGFTISDKSVRTPSRILLFLGICISSQPQCSFVSESVRAEIASRATSLLRAPDVSRRQLESFAGFINYYAPHALFLRPLQWQLLFVMNEWSSAKEEDRDRRFAPPPQMRRVFREIARADLPIPFDTPHKWEAFTVDASDTGWGASWGWDAVSGEWDSHWSLRSINQSELQAIILAVSHWKERLSGRALMVHTDNSTEAAVVRKRGSAHLFLLSSMALELETICCRSAIRVSASHVAGERNVVADALSRRRPQALEWSLSTSVFRRICDRLGVLPEVDLCATLENAKTKVFVSPLPTADLQDCLTLSWDRWRVLYAFPPPSMMPRFVKQLDRLRPRQLLILVFPWWEHRTWFHDLRSLWEENRRIPMALHPRSQDLTQQVRGETVCHPWPYVLHLHAVLLSGRV